MVIETIIAVIIVTMASILTIILAILINSFGYNETNNKKNVIFSYNFVIISLTANKTIITIIFTIKKTTIISINPD